MTLEQLNLDKSNWRKVKLGDICTLTCGSHNSNEAIENGKYTFFTAETTIERRIDEYSFDGEAIIMNRKGMAGFCKYYSGKFDVCNTIYAMLLKDEYSDSISVKFLYYTLKNKYSYILENLVHGVAIPGVKKSDLVNLDISLPQIEEQTKIANLLESYDKLIESEQSKYNKLLKQKGEISNGLFTRGFTRALESSTWTSCKLGDICTIKSGGSIKKSEYLDDGQYPIIGSNGEIGRCNQLNNNHPVLTTGRVGTIGNVFKVKDAWITDNTLILDIQNNNIEYDYLYYAVQRIDFKKITTGNAQPLVTAGRLKECEIKYPDIETQKLISELLSNYDALIENISSRANSQTTNLINQKQAIMDTIFRGGLIGGMKSPGAR